MCFVALVALPRLFLSLRFWIFCRLFFLGAEIRDLSENVSQTEAVLPCPLRYLGTSDVTLVKSRPVTPR